MTARYRALLAYDGRAYQGFQRQASGIPTIQAAVEAALLRVTGQATTVIGAGRTDTGVHAEGQVVAFDVAWKHEDDILLRALNATLPADIALQDIRQHEGFHPRFDAEARLYRYRIVQAAQRQPLLRERAWQISLPLDHTGMAEAASLLIGRHDFAAFGKPPQGTNTVREVFRSNWSFTPMPYGWQCEYHVEANAFLQHMVRRIVGILFEVGRGAMPPDDVSRLLKSGVMENGVTLAPAHGLVLEAVRYPSDEDWVDRRGRRPLEEFEDE
jgi:tRNA pseudouridine38-40 synthase